jgi:hypothetical protein
MSEMFTTQDVEMLQTHLKALITVEFFTIPFYLTGVNSFTNQALEYTPDNGKTRPLYDLQQDALSVAVQEMYHMQIACNLTNAFGEFTVEDIPTLTLPADSVIPIPHLDPGNQPLKAMLGDLPAVIDTMITIETADPNPTFPVPNATATYPSISDLYHATLSLLAKYWNATKSGDDPYLNPNSPQVAYGTFSWTYKYNTVTKRDDVMNTINAVTDQGEGKVLSPPNLQLSEDPRLAIFGKFLALFKTVDDGGVAKEFQPTAGSRFAAYGAKTHYRRFVDIKAGIEQWQKNVTWPLFYTEGAPSTDLPDWVLKEYQTIENAYDNIQSAFNTIWSALIDALRLGFQSGKLSDSDGTAAPSFNDLMLTFKYSIQLIWQLGKTPSFIYLPVTERIDMQTALDAVDHYCVVHWDTLTAGLRVNSSFVKNACQGLNTCKGMGWGGLGTKAGDGACATADFHSCGGGNNCSVPMKSCAAVGRSVPEKGCAPVGQGGCGFLSTNKSSVAFPYVDQWVPGQNACKGLGGCQTPISTGQRFAHSDDVFTTIKPAAWTTQEKVALLDLRGTDVWTHARKLLAAKLGVTFEKLPTPQTSPGTGEVVYDGDVRRAAVYPSST